MTLLFTLQGESDLVEFLCRKAPLQLRSYKIIYIGVQLSRAQCGSTKTFGTDTDMAAQHKSRPTDRPELELIA